MIVCRKKKKINYVLISQLRNFTINMTYSVIVSSAQHEIENAIAYYQLYSSNAPANFIRVIEEAYHTLETNRYFL